MGRTYKHTANAYSVRPGRCSLAFILHVEWKELIFPLHPKYLKRNGLRLAKMIAKIVPKIWVKALAIEVFGKLLPEAEQE